MSDGDGQKLYIFKTIYSLNYSKEEKLEAIKFVVGRGHYNNVVREDMWNVIKFLLELMPEEKLNAAYEKVERVANSGQWNDSVKFGMQHAIWVIKQQLMEGADETDN